MVAILLINECSHFDYNVWLKKKEQNPKHLQKVSFKTFKSFNSQVVSDKRKQFVNVSYEALSYGSIWT